MTPAEFSSLWHDEKSHVVALTSGSTGAPKEIHLSKSDMIASAEATNLFFGIYESSFLLCPLSLSYIAGKMMWVRAHVAGAEVIFVEPSLNLALPEIDRTIDLLPIVPAQIPGLLAWSGHSKVRNVIVGGAPTTAEQERRLVEKGINAYATYGMTETCSHVALRRIGYDDRFTALPGYRFDIDDRGCLIIENPSMSFGRLATNDMVELIDNSHFRIFGRYDNVIISGGEKILAERVEAAIGQEWGKSFYISSRADNVWGEACVVVTEGEWTAEEQEQFLQLCRSRLPRHHVPKGFVMEHSFSFTTSGKLIRRKY